MIPTDSRRPLITAAVAVLVLITSGTAGVAFANHTAAPADGATAPATADTAVTDGGNKSEVVSAFREQISSLKSIQMTREMTTTFGNETYAQTTQVWVDFSENQLRTEIVEAPSREGVITVRNDTTVVTYNPDENTVRRHDPYSNVSLSTVQALANESTITYEYLGVVDLNGQQTYKLAGTPQAARINQNVSMTVWVDTETKFPARVQTTSTSARGDFSSTVDYTNVTVNEPIPDSRFEIDIPENATTKDLEFDLNVSTVKTYDALQNASQIPIPKPTVPEDYEFKRGTVVDSDDYYSVSATYTTDTRQFSLSTQRGGADFDFSEMDSYEEVQIDATTTGWLYEADDTVILHWECGNQDYTIYGTIGEATATDVAASLDCD